MQQKKWLRPLLHTLAWALYFALPHLLRPDRQPQDRPPHHDGFLPPPGDLFWLYFSFLQNVLLIPAFYLNARYILPGLLRARRYLPLLAAELALFALHYGYGLGISRLLLPPDFFHPKMFLSVMSFLVVGSLSYAYYSYLESQRLQNEQREREVEAVKTELQFLRWQISPHFLFNALNNLVALARKGSDRLEPMLINLSGLMRYTIYETDEKKVSLQQEADYLQSFIRLQSLRYDRVELAVDLDVPGDSGLSIEPMLLIPFVENAFKHGIDLIREPVIRIRLEAKGSTLQLDVSNKYLPGAAYQNKDDAHGIGLANVRKRLELLYHGRYRLETDIGSWYSTHLEIDLG